MRKRGFSLLELLMVVAVISLLMGILLPALAGARAVAKRTKCLSQIRNLELAHWMYMGLNEGRFIEIDDSGNAQLSWVTTLSAYYGARLILRSPVDNSTHWPGGIPVSGTTNEFRHTSYGINNYLSTLSTTAAYTQLLQVPRPFATVHFVFMAQTGNSAGADHVHPDDWWVAPLPNAAPSLAAAEMSTNAHGGPAHSWEAITNYGFLDGHAETRRFREVYTNPSRNNFDPAVAN